MVIHIDPNEINEFIACIAYYYQKELEIEFSVTKFKTVFLDLTYGIGQCTYTNGKLHHRVFQKEFNAYAYLHYTSNHQYGVFKGIITTECHRYRTLSCNNKEYTHMCNLFRNRLLKCGYPKRFINRHMLNYEQTVGHKKPKKALFALCKIRYNKLHQQHLLYKTIFRNKHNKKEAIQICNLTGTKLKTLLLTKKRLHRKLEHKM